jgi:hypothetical protein
VICTAGRLSVIFHESIKGEVKLLTKNGTKSFRNRYGKGLNIFLNKVLNFQLTAMFNLCRNINFNYLMSILCIISCIRRNQQYALTVPLLYSTCWLLHVSAVACHHQGAYWILLSYVKYKQSGGISKIYNRYRISMCNISYRVKQFE